MFGYGNFVTMIELHRLPAKSTPLAHLVENRMSVSLDVKSSMFSFPRFWSCANFSFVIMLSKISLFASSSEGRSLNAETWTRVGGVALATCMSRIFRYWDLVIVLFLKFEYEQFLSAFVWRLVIVPGF